MKFLNTSFITLFSALVIALAVSGCSSGDASPANLRTIFAEPDFTFQLIRTAGAAPHAADIGECVETARKIPGGNTESWYTERYALAMRVERLGNGPGPGASGLSLNGSHHCFAGQPTSPAGATFS